MNTEKKSMIRNVFTRLFTLSVMIVMLLNIAYIPVFAENSNNMVAGKVYEFGEDSDYEISETEKLFCFK